MSKMLGRRRSAAEDAATDVAAVDLDELAMLEEERRFLLRSLRDLEREHEAGDLDDLDYETLRDDYTRRAADVLRRIEEGRVAIAARPAPGPSRGRRLAVAIGVLAVALLAGIVVARAAGDRAPGQTVTGDTPGSLAVLLVQASEQMAAREFVEAIKTYDEVLAVDPDNVEALTYRGWILVGTGDPELAEQGEALIDRAIAIAPAYPDARGLKGVILEGRGDLEGALEQYDEFLETPGLPAVDRQRVEAARADVVARLQAGDAPSRDTSEVDG